jgi:multicomponent Na+:H+ antiporter subunit B
MIQPYDSLIVRTVCKILIPFMQVFALYVLIHGHESPGGGFQGGAIFAASIILNRFTRGREIAPRYLPGSWALRAGAIGVMIYGGVGLLAMLFGGEFLDYGHLPLPGMAAAERRHLGILFVEIGVALAVTGILVSIFDDLAPAPANSSHRTTAVEGSSRCLP